MTKPKSDAALKKEKSIRLHKKRKRFAKTDRYYIDGKELRAEIRVYKETNEITIKLYEMLRLMCERCSTNYRFCRYTYRDELVNDAFIRCVNQIDKIDLDIENSNPFGYLSLLITNSFKATLKKEKKQQNIREKLRDIMYDDLEQSDANIQVAVLNNHDA